MFEARSEQFQMLEYFADRRREREKLERSAPAVGPDDVEVEEMEGEICLEIAGGTKTGIYGGMANVLSLLFFLSKQLMKLLSESLSQRIRSYNLLSITSSRRGWMIRWVLDIMIHHYRKWISRGTSNSGINYNNMGLKTARVLRI